MNTFQEIDDRARAIRRDHGGRTSRGLAVEIARYCVDNPLPIDNVEELLADLRRCAVACIGVGCEPLLLSPLPGQKIPGGARLAAAAPGVQAEGTTLVNGRRVALSRRWLVTVTFPGGVSRDFLWRSRAEARRCMRDFGSSVHKELNECLGYFTWDGWVVVSQL